MNIPMPITAPRSPTPPSFTPSRPSPDLTVERMEASEIDRRYEQRSAPVEMGKALSAGIEGGKKGIQFADDIEKRQKAAQFQKLLETKQEGMQAAYQTALSEGIADLPDPNLFATNSETVLSWYKILNEKAGRKRMEEAKASGAPFDVRVQIAEQYGLITPAQALQYSKPQPAKAEPSPIDEEIKEERLEGLKLTNKEKKNKPTRGTTAKPPTFDPKGLKKNLEILDGQIAKTQKEMEDHEAKAPNENAAPEGFKAWVKKRDRLMATLATFQRDRARYQARIGVPASPGANPGLPRPITTESSDEDIAAELTRRKKVVSPATIKAVRDKLIKAGPLGS